MSFDDGWAAINLEMPRRVPRTEYSAESYHWPLVERVTGITVTAASSAQERAAASAAFRAAWSYDFCWSTMVGPGFLGEFSTDMGHAVYAADGSDRIDPGTPASFEHRLLVQAA